MPTTARSPGPSTTSVGARQVDARVAGVGVRGHGYGRVHPGQEHFDRRPRVRSRRIVGRLVRGSIDGTCHGGRRYPRRSCRITTRATPSATSGAPAFDERLSVPWWWYLPTVALGVLLGAEVHMGYPGLRSWLGYVVCRPAAGRGAGRARPHPGAGRRRGAAGRAGGAAAAPRGAGRDRRPARQAGRARSGARPVRLRAAPRLDRAAGPARGHRPRRPDAVLGLQRARAGPAPAALALSAGAGGTPAEQVGRGDWPSRRPRSRSGGAVAADQLGAVALGQPAAVVHQETAGARELVGLLGQDLDGQLLARQVGTRQLEAFRRLP